MLTKFNDIKFLVLVMSQLPIQITNIF